MERVFDPVLLRTFVAVAETLSFTQAAGQLAPQPADRQPAHPQARARRRAATLVVRDTRSVSLTDNGDAMLGFARAILAAEDQAVSYFTGSAMRGRLRFGSADDLALTQLPRDPARLPAALPADQPRAHGRAERHARPSGCRPGSSTSSS